MVDQTKSSKQDLRNSVLKTLISVSDSDIRLFADRISGHVSQFTQKHPGLWGAFKSLTSEPNINFDDFKNIQACYPVVVNDQLYFIKNAKSWKKSVLKVIEPEAGLPVDLNLMTGIFVPAVAFSKTGQRLGRGRGFYDRALAGFKGLKVGINYHFNILNEIPTEAHDVGMDYIITNQEIITSSITALKYSTQTSGDF